MPGDGLFEQGRTTRAMLDAFSDSAWVAAMVSVEAALAGVEGRLGLIPRAAADRIEEVCGRFDADLASLGQETLRAASPVVPLVAALRRDAGPEAAEFVHCGATSQDVVDTAMMLLARDGLDLLIDDLALLGERCAGLAEQHRDTPMAGRTLLRQARPITFGAKAAVWMSGVDDALRRLRDIRNHGLAVQLGGPVGTLADLGDDGRAVTDAMAAELGLTAPPVPWLTNRGRVVELGAALAVAAGAAASVAVDVLLLSQTEVAEVAEATPGTSSSMPGKRNAARSVQARAAFAGVPAQVAVLVAAMAGELERPAGAWQSEAPALGELFRLCAGAVARAREAVTGLAVDAVRMRDNLTVAPQPGDLAAAARLVERTLVEHRSNTASGSA